VSERERESEEKFPSAIKDISIWHIHNFTFTRMRGDTSQTPTPTPERKGMRAVARNGKDEKNGKKHHHHITVRSSRREIKKCTIRFQHKFYGFTEKAERERERACHVGWK
jgi:hypothetical protein